MIPKFATSLSLLVAATATTIACSAAPGSDPSVETTDTAPQAVSASPLSGSHEVMDEAQKREIEARAYPNSADADGDGFYDAKYGGTDCCDADARVHPGVEEFFTETNACGGYDYNCDNTNETQFPTNKASSGLPVYGKNGKPINSYCPVSGFDGWTTCGTQNYFREYTRRFLTCHEDGFWKTQGCR